VVLWDAAQARTASGRSPSYAMDSPALGCWEQDPALWLSGLQEAVATLRERLGTPLRIDGLVFTGQMHGLVVTGTGGRPLRPALLWPDQRAAVEAREVEEAFGPERLAAVTGSPGTANYILPKLLWLRRHEPETLQHAEHVLLPKDWVRAALGGDPVTEPTDGSGTGLMHLDQLAWAPELTFGLPARMLPELVPSASVAGRLHPTWAARLGLPAGTPLIAGAGDLPAAVLATGARGAARPILNVGSAGQVALVLQTGEQAPAGAQRFCHPDPRRRIALGALLAAALAVGWARDRLGGIEPPPPEEVPGILFVPHLAGERTPSFDLRVRGAWVGLGLETDGRQMIGAAAYGVAMAYREVLEAMAGTVAGHRPIVLAEGAVASDWARRLANTLGRDVDLCTAPSPSALGACLLGAVALGARTWEELGSPETVPIARHEPAAERLAALYAVYRQVRPALAAAALRLVGEAGADDRFLAATPLAPPPPLV